MATGNITERTANLNRLNREYADFKRVFVTARRRGTEGERAVARAAYEAAGDALDRVLAVSVAPSFFIRGVA